MFAKSALLFGRITQICRFGSKVYENQSINMSKYTLVEKGLPNSTDFSIYFSKYSGTYAISFLLTTGQFVTCKEFATLMY